MVLLTDGENPIEIGDWEAIAKKLNSFNVRITIVYVALPSALPNVTDSLQWCRLR